MTTFNTDHNNTELLDQELTIEQLEAVAGGGGTPWVELDTELGGRQGTPTEFHGSGGNSGHQEGPTEFYGSGGGGTRWV